MISQIDEIRAVLKEGHAVIGRKQTLALLREKKLKKVFLASNAPAALVQNVAQYSTIRGIPVVPLPQNNEELGTLCKKPFSISVIGVQSG